MKIISEQLIDISGQCVYIIVISDADYSKEFDTGNSNACDHHKKKDCITVFVACPSLNYTVCGSKHIKIPYEILAKLCVTE